MPLLYARVWPLTQAKRAGWFALLARWRSRFSITHSSTNISSLIRFCEHPQTLRHRRFTRLVSVTADVFNLLMLFVFLQCLISRICVSTVSGIAEAFSLWTQQTTTHSRSIWVEMRTGEGLASWLLHAVAKTHYEASAVLRWCKMLLLQKVQIKISNLWILNINCVELCNRRLQLGASSWALCCSGCDFRRRIIYIIYIPDAYKILASNSNSLCCINMQHQSSTVEMY